MVDEIEGEIKLRYSDDDIVKESKATSKAIGSMADSIESSMDDIGSSTDKVSKEFEGVGKSAKSGGDKASKALDQTGEKAKKAATKLKETGSAGKKAGDDIAAGANKGERAIDQMATSASNADNSMETLSTSMIGLAQTATGVTDAVFGLNASLVGLEKTQFGIKGMEIAIQRMEEDYIVAVQEGVATTRELEKAVEDLGLAHVGLALEAKQAAADELALNGQLVTIAINTGAAIVQSVIMVKTLTTMIGVRAAVTASTTTNTAALGVNTKGAVFNMAATGANTKGIIAKTVATIASTAATVASTVATRAMTTAMLLSPLAPFAIAAIAAGAAFIALNDNIGGTRDRIEDLTGQERGSIPTLGFSILELGKTMEDTGDEFTIGMQKADDFALAVSTGNGFIPTMDNATDSVNSFNASLNPNGTLALGAFGNSLDDTTKKLIPFVNSIFDGSGNLIDFSNHMKNNNVVLDAWGKAILTSRDNLASETGQLKSNTDALIENTKAAEENAKKNDELILSINQFLSANGTLNTLISASGVPTIQGLVTQAFFNALPAGTEAGFTPTSDPVIPTITLIKQAEASALRHSIEGVAIVALGGGSLDRTQATIQQNMGPGWFTEVHTANAAGLFPFNPRTFLQQGGSFGELNAIAIKLNEGEAIRLAAVAAAIIAARAESVELLAFRLGTTAEDVSTFSQTEEALLGFIDPILAANIGLTNQQIQDFLSTEQGRRDLANRIGFFQREELLRQL